MPQRGGRRGALRSASASVYPPPPSPLPGLDQSVGARSISGDDLTREEMQAPRVGQAGLAVLVLLTLAVLYGLEELSEAIAGRSDKPCESEVRRVLNPNWTVVLAFAVFAIGAAIFLWLWQVRLLRKRLHRTLCWHAQRQRMHLAVGLEPARAEPVRSRYQSADVRWRQEDTLLDKVDSADGARRAARPPAHLAISSHSRFPPSVTSMRRGARPAGCARARRPTALTHALAHALAHAQVEDEQHPRNEHYDDLPDDLLAVPRDSMEIQNVLECNNYSRDGEPIPVRALLQRAAGAAGAAGAAAAGAAAGGGRDCCWCCCWCCWRWWWWRWWCCCWWWCMAEPAAGGAAAGAAAATTSGCQTLLAAACCCWHACRDDAGALSNTRSLSGCCFAACQELLLLQKTACSPCHGGPAGE